MPNLEAPQQRPGPVARHWLKVSLVAVVLAVAAIWYHGTRTELPPLVCDAGATSDPKATGPARQEAGRAAGGWTEATHLAWLQAREAELSPERLRLLRRLESRLEERAFAALSSAAGFGDVPVDAAAADQKREAVRETIEFGSPDENRALGMIARGDPRGGLQTLEKMAAVAAQENSEQRRRLARLSFSVDPAIALRAYEQVVRRDRSEPWDAIYLGRLYAHAGQFANAERAYGLALDQLPASEERVRAIILTKVGNLHAAKGDLAAATKSYASAQAIFERQARREPDNDEWQADLANGFHNVGSAQAARGDQTGALKSYRLALGIRQRLVESEPGSAGRQHDLAVIHSSIGAAQMARGDLDAALSSHGSVLSILGGLAVQDPSNVYWAHDLSIGHVSIGLVRLTRGDPVGALESFHAASAIVDRLNARAPADIRWQRSLSLTHNQIGDALMARGDLACAMERYAEALDIRGRLAGRDPSNALRQ